MIKPHHQNNRSHDGFTIIEIALVVLISGILFTMFLGMYASFSSRQAYMTTIQHMDMADKAITGFKSENGYFPCPADPTLPPDHPDYGLALDCGSAALTENGQCSPTTRPRLSNGALSNVICTNVGTREVFPGSGPEYVLIGILPFRSMSNQTTDTSRLPEYASFDGYGNRFTYAITERMADSFYNLVNPIGINWGAIPMFDESGRMITDPASNVYYTLISHGENGKGAYNQFGTMTESCVNGLTTPPTPGLDNPIDPIYGGQVQMEIENCDYNDGVFRSALLSKGNGIGYFDDIVFYRNIIDEQLWAESATSTEGNIAIYNTNNGFVGVGTQAPVSPLDVQGDLIASRGTNAQDGYCDNTRPIGNSTNAAPECFEPATISGPVTTCPSGQIAVGFRKNALLCRAITVTGTVNIDCGTNPAGERLFARGLIYDTVNRQFAPFNCSRPY